MRINLSHLDKRLLIFIWMCSMLCVGCEDPPQNDDDRQRFAVSLTESEADFHVDHVSDQNELSNDFKDLLENKLDSNISLRDTDTPKEDLSTSYLDAYSVDDTFLADQRINDDLLTDLFLYDALPRDSLLADSFLLDATIQLDVSIGPTTLGEYTYTSIPSSLINPPAVSWHPSGAYALVLNQKDTIYRFRDNDLEEVASEGNRVRWRNITFTPSGDYAIILATYTSDGEGRIYVWDHSAETLSELATQRFSDGRYENIEYLSNGTHAKLLGTKTASNGFLAYIWDFDLDLGRTNLSASATSARCEDLAWVRDSLDMNTVAITCGHNGIDLYHLGLTGDWIPHRSNAGNTSFISARPQGDYALAVTDTSHKLYHFRAGVWNTDFSSPFLPGSMNVEFSTDGRRALIFGGVDRNSNRGQVYEYRHEFYTIDEIFPVFISNLDHQSSHIYFNDVGWRPDCDQGLIVGGTDTLSRQFGSVIYFSVTNGIQCVHD
jgi:hypothetical protein